MSTKNKQTSALTSNSQSFSYAGEPRIVQMSKHKPVDVKPLTYRDWILNGENNANFKRYKDAYDDSPTNASIINGVINYIFAEGLIDLNGKDLEKYIEPDDVLLMAKDLKINGGFSFQVIWSEAEIPLKIKYIEIAKLGIRYDLENYNEVLGYWYSYDWKDQFRYTPEFYPKFTGEYNGNGLEIGYFRRATNEPFFPVPDYFSALQWAEVEGEQANAGINHFLNSMSDITVINYNNGSIPDPVKAKQEADKRREQVCGTNKQSTVIIQFNDTPEEATVIDRISPPELNQQNVFYAEEAEKKLILGHSVPSILFAGTNAGTGFSSNAEEREIAIKDLYRRHINPDRNILLRAFKKVFKLIDEEIKLDFKDFESETLDETETKVIPIQGQEATQADAPILDNETLKAQASLKGSVGGVQALLDIQNSYAEGTTDYESAVAMLDIIFGYNAEQAVKLLGNPKQTVI